ncbi:MAG: HIT family protein [Bacilli bacterium]|jgi:histidine triad (HIT) family protein|nr:HIT family protein [Bacilli bacterium]
MTQNDSCIFCRIARGEIPSYKVYEDDICLAFLDINPSSKGHTLVLPKEHFSSFVTCPKAVMDHCYEVAQMIAQAQMHELGASGVNILSNVGKSAGQSISHFHIHVIPRYDNDGLKLEFKPQAIEDKELLLLADTLKKSL